MVADSPSIAEVPDASIHTTDFVAEILRGKDEIELLHLCIGTLAVLVCPQVVAVRPTGAAGTPLERGPCVPGPFDQIDQSEVSQLQLRIIDGARG